MLCESSNRLCVARIAQSDIPEPEPRPEPAGRAAPRRRAGAQGGRVGARHFRPAARNRATLRGLFAICFSEQAANGIDARAWSARWEDRTKADAFVAAMGRIREEMVQQYEDDLLRDLERRIRERRMRGEYGSDSDEEDY